MAMGLPFLGRLALCDWEKSMSAANQLVDVPGSMMYKPPSMRPKPSSSVDLESLFEPDLAPEPPTPEPPAPEPPAPEQPYPESPSISQPILGESLQSIMDAAKEQIEDLEGELNRSPKKRKRNKVPYHMAADVGKLMGLEALCCKSYIYYYPCKDQGMKGCC